MRHMRREQQWNNDLGWPIDGLSGRYIVADIAQIYPVEDHITHGNPPVTRGDAPISLGCRCFAP